MRFLIGEMQLLYYIQDTRYGKSLIYQLLSLLLSKANIVWDIVFWTCHFWTFHQKFPSFIFKHGVLGLRNLIYKATVFFHVVIALFFAFIVNTLERCVVYGCSNTASPTKSISVYRIPYWNDNSPIAKSRRKKWISFVQRKRDNWQPSIGSVVCVSAILYQGCYSYLAVYFYIYSIYLNADFIRDTF